MMWNLDHEAVEGLPSGLCACRIGDTQMHIAALSPRSVWLRTQDAQLPGGALTLCLYRPESGETEFHTPVNVQAGPAQRSGNAVLTRLSFDDPACSAAIRRTLNSYARYLEIKSCDGASAYAAYAVGYPQEQDDVFLPDLTAQRKAWFSGLSPLPELPPETELAVELNCPELWSLYLRYPLSEFMAAYAASRNLPEAWLPERLPDRLYIGNPYCRHLFPEEALLQSIREKARAEGLALTLVTAELRSHSASLADRQIAHAAEWNAELVVNDWGMLQRTTERLQPGQMVLGTMLNRRRKDPRAAYKAGLAGREGLLSRNSLNDDGWAALLNSMGVRRFEFESCALPVAVPEGSHSLHLPFYQTNTSLWCPTRALCLHGDRGRQADAAHCPRYCENNIILYPAHLKMLGRWNSLLALDSSLAALREPARFDRWVLNF